MANRLNGFLNSVWQGASNPKGTLGDYQHASRLFIADSFRLSPKQKFLFHVCFNINANVPGVANFTQKHGREINMLVKDISLPGFKINTETLQQYNRKKQIQTGIDYDPVRITLHDDNFGLTTLLWQAYYRYYYADGNHATADGAGKINESSPAYAYNNAYKSSEANQFRYGFDNGSKEPFFTSIQVFQMSRHQYQAFTLVNPIVSSWGHDNMSYEDGSGIVESEMEVAYETVWYSSGEIEEDNAPKGFATQDHYDKTPSPLSIEGGGTTSVFGQGGVAGGLTGVFASLGDPTTYQDPKKFLGTLLKAGNTYTNLKGLTKEGLRAEGLSILRDGLKGIKQGGLGGITDATFPKGLVDATKGLLGGASAAIKSIAPGPLISKLLATPPLLDAVASKVHALGSLKSPGAALAEYGNLSASAKTAAKQGVIDKISAGDPKVTQIASQAAADYDNLLP